MESFLNRLAEITRRLIVYDVNFKTRRKSKKLKNTIIRERSASYI